MTEHYLLISHSSADFKICNSLIEFRVYIFLRNRTKNDVYFNCQKCLLHVRDNR